jgi:hypothetical protein
MSLSIDELRTMLTEGLKRSLQGSYRRRSPASEALPHLRDARDGLARFVHENASSDEGWRLLSRAEEALLRYGPAIEALDKAIALSSQRSRKDLKRLAALKEAHAEWSALPLTPAELASLKTYLESHLDPSRIVRSFEWTLRWLRENEVESPSVVIEAFEARGASSDFQVLYNIAR